MQAYERLIRYAAAPTASDAASSSCPTTPEQLEFARALADEMRAIGLSDISLDENGYLFAAIPASPGCEDAPAIGFIAHMDVVRDVEFRGVMPQIVHYTGGDVVIDGRTVISAAENPDLAKYVGETLITSDGTTLLGADDKAGIAVILTAAERMLAGEVPHGKICIGFTPDEEIGRGADRFDVQKFGAKWAYTLDGGAFGEIEYETFNAAAMEVRVTGMSYHPGSSKDRMVNASVVAMEFAAMLPALERPEHTSGYEGFYHLTHMEGRVADAKLSYILRDHDAALLEAKKAHARRAAELLNRRYGAGTVELAITDSYRNMREAIEGAWHLIENANAAIREAGGEPVSEPVRGGTDGSRLSFMGLPCPNLGTGAHNAHGTAEYAVAEEMERCVVQLLALARRYADFKE